MYCKSLLNHNHAATKVFSHYYCKNNTVLEIAKV